jgi:oligopeptide transport system substrate-binding protein
MSHFAKNCRRSVLCSGIFLRTCIVFAILFSISCSEIKQPAGNSFFAITPPPPKQEFRWSNGRMPRHLDPARAAAAPETDVVRAMYEGLTEINPVTLEAIPGVAEKWTSSDDLKTWTFTLRENAVWSNGKPVTAQNFVTSWARLAELGAKAAHPELRSNIVGLLPQATDDVPVTADNDFIAGNSSSQADTTATPVPNTNANSTSTANTESSPETQNEIAKKSVVPGFRAVDERTFEVKLLRPDKDFPKLVANPIFLPVFDGGKEFESGKLNTNAVTNGAFRLASVDPKALTLERSETYWNRETVALERVIFKPAAKAEDALLAYRSGELDAVTNANFEPLALKLLEPYEDFRRNPFAALNYYKVNTENYPFSDRRVRQALAMSIERERLTEGELEGSTRPALSFLPFATGSQKKLVQDKDRARDLLDEAGFPEGEQFPVVRLVVNRNDIQQRIARSVARMWKQNLNVETEIIVRDTAEMASTLETGDFDLVRRGTVIPTADESVGMSALFGVREAVEKPSIAAPTASPTPSPTPENLPTLADMLVNGTIDDDVLSEDFALFEMEAIPLYFPTSYSLVKPYVIGFDMNVFDAPLLRGVRIDNNWQPTTVGKP